MFTTIMHDGVVGFYESEVGRIFKANKKRLMNAKIGKDFEIEFVQGLDYPIKKCVKIDLDRVGNVLKTFDEFPYCFCSKHGNAFFILSHIDKNGIGLYDKIENIPFINL